MAIAKIGTDVEASPISATSPTMATAYTPAAGSNRIVVMAVTSETSNTLNEIAWGAKTLTGGHWILACELHGLEDVWIYYIKEADFASGSNVVVTMSAATVLRGDIYCLSGVNQTTPLSDTATDYNGDASATSLTATVTVPSGGFAVASCAKNYTVGEDVAFAVAWTTERVGAYATSNQFGFATILTAGNQDPAPSWTTAVRSAVAVAAFAPAASTTHFGTLLGIGG